MTDRPYMDKWADDILKIAEGDWSNPVLLNHLYKELKYRSSNAGCRVREIVLKRIEELKLAENTAFKWPTTDAPAGANGFTGDHFWYQEGLLSFVGYRVGKTHGVPRIKRQQILDCVIFNTLPRVNSQEYMDEWGHPRTAQRLRKLAEALASFTRNAKRKNSRSMEFAIDDWEADLSYLYESYYHEKLGFYWPDSDL